jgi:hypothetical protein
MIDFGIARGPGSEAFPVDYSRHAGTYFLLEGNTRIYDDAYSFLQMLDFSGIPAFFKEKECFRRIERLVGGHAFTVELPEINK